MKSSLKYHSIENFTTETGVVYDKLELSYELFGRELHTSSIVLVNHALTGNSDVGSSHSGWWNGIISEGNLIDTNTYTVICFNILGNGYDNKPENLIDNYKDFTARDIGRLFGKALKELGVQKLHATIGGSLGGGIAWEMAVLFPDLATHLISIAADWKAADWILAHNKVQEQILLNSRKPVHDARIMAMLFYRTAASFKQKFNRSINKNLGIPNVESWLLKHGARLENRFDLKSYKMVNNLLSTLDIVRDRGTFEEVVLSIKSNIIQIGIDSDFFFVADENRNTKKILDKLGVKNTYKEIKSIHGHDGFLVENEQLRELLREIF